MGCSVPFVNNNYVYNKLQSLQYVQVEIFDAL